MKGLGRGLVLLLATIVSSFNHSLVWELLRCAAQQSQSMRLKTDSTTSMYSCMMTTASTQSKLLHFRRLVSCHADETSTLSKDTFCPCDAEMQNNLIHYYEFHSYHYQQRAAFCIYWHWKFHSSSDITPSNSDKSMIKHLQMT